MEERREQEIDSMEHKWLGLGLVAMGLAGLFAVMSGEGGGEAKDEVAAVAGVGSVKMLPKGAREGGVGIYGALAARASDRGFTAGGTVDDELLGKILWAACGVNRADGRWTIPTALDTRDLRVYVLDRDGGWLYEPEKHALTCCAVGDLRGASGRQGFVADAALNLVYAVDMSKEAARGVPETAILKNGAFEAGCAAQGVALVCASEGLKNVVRGSVDGEIVGGALGLPEGVVVLMAQSVGP